MCANKPIILLVDDEPNILSSLRRLLRKEPYTILSANSAKEGLEILKEQTVSLIISDQRMPEMCGVDFLRQVKTLYSDTIRVILSGYTDVNAIMSAINEGEVYKFITKPWNDEEIKVSIKRALEQYELLNENRGLNKKISEQNEKLKEMVGNLEKMVEERTIDLKIHNDALLISQSIVENLPIGLIGIDEGKNIVMANRHIHSIFLLGPGQMLGKLSEDILPEEVCKVIDKAFETYESYSFTLSVESSDTAVKEKKMQIDVLPVAGVRGRGVVLMVK